MGDPEVTVVVHQPDFIPYLGFFHRLLWADVWVVLDDVQLNREGWVHRDRIKTPYGPKWLSIPLKKGPLQRTIVAVETSSTEWREEHLRKWYDAYSKAPHAKCIMALLEAIYACKSSSLANFTLHSIDILLKTLNIFIPRILRSSEMNVQGSSNALVANLVQQCGGTRYLSGIGAHTYFDPAPYAEAHIEVVWQNFVHPVYPQLHGEFIPSLTTVDTLFNCGIEGTRNLLLNLKKAGL